MTMIAQVCLNLLFTKDKKKYALISVVHLEKCSMEGIYFVLFSLCFHRLRTESGGLQARQVP